MHAASGTKEKLSPSSSNEENNIEIIKLLNKGKGNINQRDNNGITPLWIAIETGNLEVAKFIIAKGGNVDVKTTDGKSLLEMAKQGRHTGIIRILENKLNSFKTKTITPLAKASSVNVSFRSPKTTPTANSTPTTPTTPMYSAHNQGPKTMPISNTSSTSPISTIPTSTPAPLQFPLMSIESAIIQLEIWLKVNPTLIWNKTPNFFADFVIVIRTIIEKRPTKIQTIGLDNQKKLMEHLEQLYKNYQKLQLNITENEISLWNELIVKSSLNTPASNPSDTTNNPHIKDNSYSILSIPFVKTLSNWFASPNNSPQKPHDNSLSEEDFDLMHLSTPDPNTTTTVTSLPGQLEAESKKMQPNLKIEETNPNQARIVAAQQEAKRLKEVEELRTKMAQKKGASQTAIKEAEAKRSEEKQKRSETTRTVTEGTPLQPKTLIQLRQEELLLKTSGQGSPPQKTLAELQQKAKERKNNY